MLLPDEVRSAIRQEIYEWAITGPVEKTKEINLGDIRELAARVYSRLVDVEAFGNNAG